MRAVALDLAGVTDIEMMDVVPCRRWMASAALMVRLGVASSIIRRDEG